MLILGELKGGESAKSEVISEDFWIARQEAKGLETTKKSSLLFPVGGVDLEGKRETQVKSAAIWWTLDSRDWLSMPKYLRGETPV